MVKCFSTEFEHNITYGKIQVIKLSSSMSFSMSFVYMASASFINYMLIISYSIQSS